MRCRPLALLLVTLVLTFFPFATLRADSHPYELLLHSENAELKQVLLSNMKTQRERILAQNERIGRARLADQDIEVLEDILHAQGYYEASVIYEPGSQEDKTENLLKYHIVEGPRYHIGEVKFRAPDYLLADPDFDSGLQTGAPLLATTVLAARGKLQQKLERACLLEVDVRHKVYLSKSKQIGDVLFSLKKTKKAKVQNIEFFGLQTLDEKYLLNRVDLEKGACFDRSKIEQVRLDLLRTNLLSRVETSIIVAEDAPVLEGGFVPVTVKYSVEERKQKTIRFGLGYSTDEGAGWRGGWEHRNLFGSGENLKFETGVNEVKKYLNGEYRIQDFLKKNQTLILLTELKEETTEAFESSRAKSSAAISRKLSERIVGEVGVALSHSEVTEDGDTERFNLLSWPARISIEGRNNILDPTSGWYATTSITPFTELEKEDVRFLQWTASGSVYFSADVAMRPTLALRVAMGASTGTSLENIPADERFYVGGGGSVRGYAYQTVGNLTDSEPDGGKSFAETTAELRFRTGKNWGFVLFCDAGYAYAEELPEFGTDFLWGAGLGLRYHTSFAPIRFDIATPLNKREGVDDSVQFYVSIGQSF